MNHKEKNFSNVLKKYYLQENFFFDKIESRMTAGGIPDLLVVSPMGIQNFIELKVVEADMKLSLTKGQVSFHSKRRMRGVRTPVVVLVEPLNKMLVMASTKALDLYSKGGKLNIHEVPDICWFKRTAVDYAMLTYTTTDLFLSSPRVYK